ncbi:MAG: hypothetical protein EBX95_10350 [Acidimicrobiia bacterium]|nr:hypothetical protein [Acidimicrobiia bacterium]
MRRGSSAAGNWKSIRRQYSRAGVRRTIAPVPALGFSPTWNFADSWEAIAHAVPEAPAQYGFAPDGSPLQFSWSRFDQRANGIARAFLDAGAAHQDKVAQYMYNCPQYLESIHACFKAGLAPVNTNYRYTPDELVYIWDNADVVSVVFHGCFSDVIDGLRHRVPRVVLWLWVDDASGPCPTWAVDYEEVANQGGNDPVVGSWGRSGDDLLLIYTGGTTGMPKGVMWRQEDLLLALDDANRVKLPESPDMDAVRARTTKIGPRNLPAAPLMHGTGLFNAMSNLMMAGSIVTMRGRKFDPVELLDTIQLLSVNSMSIVGDAFAKPILRALDAEPDRWNLSSLRVIISSGVMFAAETKGGLLRHNQRLIMVDALGSSEAIGSLLQTRCLRWQRAWLDDKERTRKSAHRFYTEQLDLQAKQLIETPGDRLDLQSQRLVEIVALNFALSVGCRQSSLLVKTPRDIGTSDDARNGALLTAIQEAQTQAVLIDASDAGEQEIAAREAQESLDRHRNLPVLNPMGGQP